MGGSLGLAQEPAPPETPDRPLEDVTVLPAFEVKGVRMEELGFRLSANITLGLTVEKHSAMVSEVFPNTAAAKAGLKPGELIEKIDGKSVSLFTVLSLGMKPDKLQQRKWAELAAGKKDVKLTLQVRAPAAKESHTVTLVLPSPAPHWGSDKWSAPEDRMPAVVQEAGPLAALAREVLDNGIWSTREMSRIDGAPVPVLGYEWRIVQPGGTHRIWVTQQRGKTEITLEHRAPKMEMEFGRFRTSPSGAMDKGDCLAPKIKGHRKEFSAEEVRAEFEAEIDFWLTKVGRVTGRWPFEALSGKTEVISSIGSQRTQSSGSSAPLSESFLKLPLATAAQKELFSDALGKVGRDAEGWAFTETSRSLSDNHVTTVRFDPSKPPDDSCILLKVDGKAPKADYLKQWKTEGHEPLPGLGELPPLSGLVDLDDVRIFSDEIAAVVFELPVKTSNAGFPADKFQARFRVNKTHRGFEDFAVKLREPMRMAGVAKVTDVGLEARFQMLDPALAPQPVLLKMGGGVRVLFVNLARTFEITRSDFKRVEPFDQETAAIAAPALK